MLVQAYDREPDDESEELLTPDGKTQDECYPRFAHLRTGESLVLPDEPKTTTSGSRYPSQYEDLDEFLNSDPGAIDKLDSGSRSRRFDWRYYEPDESL